MTPNPLLAALGLSRDDRAVLIHTDDIGMCQASLAAYADLAASGTISAGSTMVPCPWFPATAQFCRAHPDIVDMGVHVTLTSEWQTGYRWRPISTCDPDTGLIDGEGYLPHTSEAVHQQASPDAVRREIVCQLNRALDAGIDVTHLDAHMGTVFHPRFLQAYIETALDHQIPPFLVRNVALALRRTGVAIDKPEELTHVVAALEAQGVPMFDDVRTIPFARVPAPPAGAEDNARAAWLDRCFEQAQQMLDDLQPGLSYLIIHPSKETPELRAILPEGWSARVADYEIFMRAELRAHIEDRGIHIVTWRTLRDLMRARAGV